MPNRDGSARSARWRQQMFAQVMAVWTLPKRHRDCEQELDIIKRSIDQHLINWKTSLRFELNADEVICLTPNLVWARKHIDDIIGSLQRKGERKFRYIVFNNKMDDGQSDPDDPNDPVKAGKTIIARAKEHEDIKRRNQIEILFLTEDHHKSVFWRPNTEMPSAPPQRDLAYLPIPTDIAVFLNTPANPDNTPARPEQDASQAVTFAVLSVVPVEDRVVSMAADRTASVVGHALGIHADGRQYLLDIQLRQSEHYDPIIDWFNTEWNKREMAIANKIRD
jgi:hypothetical protein